MTASDKLKQKVVHRVTGETLTEPEAITERINEIGDDGELCDYLHDAREQLRCGTTSTGLECEYSRHYSSKAVAAQMLDGSWVGWTFWFGGGKHGEPGAVEWIEDAYDVEMREVQKVVKEFTRVEQPK